jgi:hypothetical protein
VQSAIARSLGPQHELAEKLRSNSYGLMMWSRSTPDNAWERAFSSGVETAVGYIEAAIFELGLIESAEARRASGQSPRSKGSDIDPEPDRRAIFVIHGRDLAARDAMFELLRAIALMPIEWNQAVVATEDRPRTWVTCSKQRSAACRRFLSS